ncbi:Cell surface glycoprotein 1 [Amphibalanus amphitrite]|uniref:Cell surface glycoprotein 1 n=1 Tax=Amphibalanus amphitrite TaxID=1232801 RepID=A0A6A4X7T9_AMPAM|nr:Cell surface glycoprotein 1 [Amphibalanus amphitrite]
MPKRQRSRLGPRDLARVKRQKKTSNIFLVNQIHGDRTTERGKEYLVSWIGYPDECPTWEPEQHLIGNIILQDYKERRRCVDFTETQRAVSMVTQEEQTLEGATSVETSEKPTPVETPGKPTPVETPGKPTPVETPGKPTPVETPGKPTPVETPGKPTPVETPEKPTPVETSEKPTPVETPGKPTPVETPEKPTPVETLEGSTAEVLEEATHGETLEGTTPVETSEKPTPVETPGKPTHEKTLEGSTAEVLEGATHGETLEGTTPVETSEKPTPVETPGKPTPVETPEKPTPVETSEKPTPVETPGKPTPVETPEKPTPVETLEGSTAEVLEEATHGETLEGTTPVEMLGKPTSNRSDASFHDTAVPVSLPESNDEIELQVGDLQDMWHPIFESDTLMVVAKSGIPSKNFQRSGVIKNARLDEYAKMKNEVLRVKDHKSNATYGSANLVVRGLVKHLEVYVEHFRSFLVTEDKVDLLFPSSDPADDIAEVCRGFQVDFKLTPTMIRKAASTAAYDDLTDSERRKLADHMTHRSATQFRAYSAKNRRAEATKTVQKMKQVLYGCDETTDTEDSEPRPAAVAFSSEEVAVLEKQVRKMISDGTFVSSRLALTMMSRNSPLFDSRSPKCVENKLRAMLQSAREKGRWDRYADERGGRSRRR